MVSQSPLWRAEAAKKLATRYGLSRQDCTWCNQKRHRDDPRQTVCEGVDQAVRQIRPTIIIIIIIIIKYIYIAQGCTMLQSAAIGQIRRNDFEATNTLKHFSCQLDSD